MLLKDLLEPWRLKFINTWLNIKNTYIGKLEKIVNKYNNTYHRTIKMKPVNVKPSIYIDFNKENNKEDPKFKIGDHLRTSKYKKF